MVSNVYFGQFLRSVLTLKGEHSHLYHWYLIKIQGGFFSSFCWRVPQSKGVGGSKQLLTSAKSLEPQASGELSLSMLPEQERIL